MRSIRTTLGVLSFSFLFLTACGDNGDSSPGESESSGSGESGETDTTTDASQSDSTTSDDEITDTPDFTDPTTTDSQTGSTATESTDSNSSSSSGTDTTDENACAGEHRCIQAVPVDWEGPIARKFRTTPDADFVPPCGGSYPFTQTDKPLHAQPNFPDASCSECKCVNPGGVECKTTELEFFSDGTCDNSLTQETVLVDECSLIFNQGGDTKSLKVKVPELKANSGSCEAKGGFPTLDVGTWNHEERHCRTRDIGNFTCVDAGDICVPQVSEGFEAGVCIYKDGDVPCPEGDYSVKEVRYQGEADNRGCTECTCGAPTGPDLNCASDILLYSDEECPGGAGGAVESIEITSSDTCPAVLKFPGQTPRSVFLDVQVEGLATAKCAASGGTASGEVVGLQPVTVCCTPE